MGKLLRSTIIILWIPLRLGVILRVLVTHSPDVYVPWEGSPLNLLAVLALLHGLEHFSGHENLRVVVIFPVLNVERHFRGGNRGLGLHTFHPRDHVAVPEVVGAGWRPRLCKFHKGKNEWKRW